MKQTLIGLALCALLAWAVLRQTPPQNGVEHRELFALGTLVQISIAQPLPDGLINQVQQELQRFELRWSPRGDGALAELNTQLASQTVASLPEKLQAGFQVAQQACRSSQGLFDPAMGALVGLWGFDDESHFRDSPPAAAEIAGTLAASHSLCDAELSDHIQLSSVGTQFDFGASAKGRAVDEITVLLQKHGINNAIVNAGGDLKALGQHPERPWRIGIRHPRAEDGQQVIASLEVRDQEALFSSGDYERYFIHAGRRYHHILDPRSGYPADSSQSATVIHKSAELADAAATALFVAGPQLAAQTMQNMGIDLYLLVDANAGLHMSEAMRTRLDLTP